MLFNDLSSTLYLSTSNAACYEDAPAAGASGAAPVEKPTEPVIGANGEKLLTQEQFNKALAEDRRKHKAALEQTEKTYQDLLATNQNLTEKERQTLKESLETVQGQLRTKDQTAAMEKKAIQEEFSAKLTEAAKNATHWEARYREETVTRALTDAALANDAFKAEQIVLQLRSMTKLVEVVDKVTGKPTGKLQPMVEFPDVDATSGEPILTTRTPDEAVKRMKELPGIYGNLFKSNVVSGIASNSSTAGIPVGSSGRIDVRNLTPQQYRDIRAKNPELLGLKSKSGHRR